MNVGGVTFLVVAAVFLVALPRRSAVIPLLMAAVYTTRLPVVELGPASLSVLRLLVIVGIVRVLVRGERITNGLNTIDGLVLSWAALLFGVSAFHTSDAWVFRGGRILGEIGTYMLCRIFIRDAEDVRRLFKVMCVALVPLAVLMLMEKQTAHNYFEFVGQASEVNIRDGRVRAHGPFAHPILAGTVGAGCIPMALCLWKSDRRRALVGFVAAAGIVFASNSSGPVMMVLFTCIGLGLWKVRDAMSLIRWGTVVAIIGLQMLMTNPVYFLMERIDITGSSSGWHRAQLISAALERLDEWWAVGTDYTRHWMPTGIHANATHTDITNHFLAMGVMGGLPLMFLFVLVLWAAFRAVGRMVSQYEHQSPEMAFLCWTLGAMLFGQVMNFWSISLFDQSVSFLYLALAMIGAVQVPVGAGVHEAIATPAPPASSRRWKREAPALPAALATGGAPNRAGRRDAARTASREVERWTRISTSRKLAGNRK